MDSGDSAILECSDDPVVFCFSLSLEAISYQLSAISYQLSAISYQILATSYQSTRHSHLTTHNSQLKTHAHTSYFLTLLLSHNYIRPGITKQLNMQNAISWFEIPSNDLDRATRFYETIFGIKLFPMDMPQLQMRLFLIDDPMTGIGGAIVYAEGFYQTSSTDGPLVYLNANPDVQLVLDRIEAAGGKIVVPKTQITPEYGYMAVFIDTEGNRIALHSVPEKA